MNEKLLISFSGGETSAYMTQWCLTEFKGWKDMVVVFANTGEENEETLEFVNRCDKELGFNVVWIEAVVNNSKNKGTTHKIVSYETASRKGQPFKDVISKYGIPNTMFPHCSREMKAVPIRSYARSIGWKKGDYKIAIGIRSDEADRISKDYVKECLWYPLIKAGITKPFINRFWEKQSFRLNLMGYEGNCKVCWKKSLRKLMQIAKDNPEKYENFKLWEEEFGKFIPEGRSAITENDLPIRFFRKNLSTDRIIELSTHPFKPPHDDATIYKEYIQYSLFDYELDISSGCVESCEVF
jgi:7-cyano-7-deazaguanine synthase in queuosine biosynthesis